MNAAQTLLKDARGDLEPWIQIPEERILSTAKKCGPMEIAEILSMHLMFEQERRELPEWDRDSSDETWRAQVMFSKLLSGVPDEHLSLVAEGLKSDSETVRFYTAPLASIAPRSIGSYGVAAWMGISLTMHSSRRDFALPTLARRCYPTACSRLLSCPFLGVGARNR